MSYTPTMLEQAVYSWLARYLPSTYTVIYANRMSPRPLQPFATLMSIEDTRMQVQDAWRLTDEPDGVDYIAVHTVEREAMFSVQLFGSTAYQDATALARRLTRRDINAFNAGNGIFFRRSTSVRRISEQTSTEIEARAQFDVTFGYRLAEEHTYEGLEEINYDIIIED